MIIASSFDWLSYTSIFCLGINQIGIFSIISTLMISPNCACALCNPLPCIMHCVFMLLKEDGQVFKLSNTHTSEGCQINCIKNGLNYQHGSPYTGGVLKFINCLLLYYLSLVYAIL